MKLLLLLLLMTLSVSAQNYELGTGIVISEDKDMQPGYTIEANFIVKLDQNRDYLNNLIFGFSHSGFMSNNKYYSSPEHVNIITSDCNCGSKDLNFDGTYNFSTKKQTRSVSLTLGVEIARRWYILSGVTSYQHITLLNNDKIVEIRNVEIDAGIKYFIKWNKAFVTPTFRFNPQTITFSLGYSR